CLRCSRSCGRERGLRILFAVPALGFEAGRRVRGLVPTSWDGSHDQWGAVQLQDRFMKQFSRRMTARDMQSWTAVRMIGESASRTRSTDPKAMLDFLKPVRRCAAE